jgi:hypothetical protein
MQYLLELNEFDENSKLQQIYNRIESSGYLSKSAEKEIVSISGMPNCIDDIYARIDEVIKFYNKYDKEFFDDILLEFFEGTDYTYQITIAAEFGQRYGDRLLIKLDDKFSENDTENYLLKKIISTIISSNRSEVEKDKKSEKDDKLKDWWIRNPRGRVKTKKNFFKLLSIFTPVIEVYVRHKEYLNYYHNDDPITSGWTPDMFNSYRDNAILTKIRNRFGRIGKCDVREDGYSSYTGDYMNYIIDPETGEERRIPNPNRFLISGGFKIKFEL